MNKDKSVEDREMFKAIGMIWSAENKAWMHSSLGMGFDSQITPVLAEKLESLIEQERIKVARAGMKSGFYAGQAMAEVELEQCHKNWKKWNGPPKEHRAGKDE